jgi:translation initiation factor 2 alpha subunit (eIF-2alpha)
MGNLKLEEGDFVLCTVDRIIGTVVFVKIEGLPENIEGNIVVSEIAPGRIRNLRDYVVPKKKIVCKVLRIDPNGNINLSLRRVSQKEAKEVMERYGEERSYISILRSLVEKDFEKILQKIEETASVYDFISQAKENPKPLENLVGKENTKKILDIVSEQKKKNFESKREINLTTTNPHGIEIIKNILTSIKNVKISYIAAGRYSIQAEDSDPKISGNKLRQALVQIEEQAKKAKIEFNVK